MAIPKAGSIALGLVGVGVGVFLMVRGIGELTGSGPKDLKWGPNRATSVALGDFTIKVPDGWRDASEAGDDKIKSLLAQQPGAKVFVREAFDGQTVLIKAGPNDVGSPQPPCADLAAMVAKNEGAATSGATQQTYDGDAGCRWVAKKGSVEMQYNVRFHGPQIFLVACSGADGATCQQVLAGVTVKK